MGTWVGGGGVCGGCACVRRFAAGLSCIVAPARDGRLHVLKGRVGRCSRCHTRTPLLHSPPPHSSLPGATVPACPLPPNRPSCNPPLPSPPNVPPHTEPASPPHHLAHTTCRRAIDFPIAPTSVRGLGSTAAPSTRPYHIDIWACPAQPCRAQDRSRRDGMLLPTDWTPQTQEQAEPSPQRHARAAGGSLCVAMPAGLQLRPRRWRISVTACHPHTCSCWAQPYCPRHAEMSPRWMP